MRKLIFRSFMFLVSMAGAIGILSVVVGAVGFASIPQAKKIPYIMEAGR